MRPSNARRGAWSLAMTALALGACAARPSGLEPVQVFAEKSALRLPGGLQNTSGTAEIVPVQGMPFKQAVKVVIGRRAHEANATQLTILTERPVAKGEVLCATLWLRGRSGSDPAQVELLFEKSADPWTKSISRGIASDPDPSRWRKASVVFASSEAYQPGEAMLSIRMAFAPQAFEIGGVSLVAYGPSATIDQVLDLAASGDRQPPLELSIDARTLLQPIRGLGGNFCQPRYGSSESMDAVGRTVIRELKVAYARVGLPLNSWAPEKGRYDGSGPAGAAMEAMRILKDKGADSIATVWEGPAWMVGGSPEQSGRPLPRERWADCIEALAQWILEAKRRHGVEPAWFSFNEPDYGVNIRFTPQEQADFIRQAGPAWKAKGIGTKFLIGDTTSGGPAPAYIEHLVAQKDVQPYLGPIAFHSWDVLGASDAAYLRIAELARASGREVWCTEGGWDAQLWTKPGAWGSWENAVNTARAYAKTFRLSRASRIDYWTYQDNYPLVDPKTLAPYPVLGVMKMMEDVFTAGSQAVSSTLGGDDVEWAAVLQPKGAAFLLASSAGRREVRAAGLAPGQKYKVTVMTSNSHATSTLVKAGPKGELSLTLPTRSVVTAVPAEG